VILRKMIFRLFAFQKISNKHLLLQLILTLYLPVFLYAQIGLKLTHETLFDSNVFNNYENISDIVHQPNIHVFYQISKDNIAIQTGYNGSLVTFSESQNRQFHSHQIEIAGKHLLSKNGSSLSWGISGSKRFNKSDYDYYDNQYGNGFITYLNNTNPYRIYSFGIEGDFRKYDYLKQFNYWTAEGSIRYSIFFQSKTTLIGRWIAGFKQFTEPFYSEEEIIDVLDTYGKGKGHGSGKGSGSNQNMAEEVTQVVRIESPRQAVFKWIGILRLAQSLGSQTGLAIQGEIQKIPEGGGRFLSGQDSGYENNDVLFDDPYSYERLGASLELTKVLPWKIVGKTGFEYAEKTYDRPVYDWDGNPLEGINRSDKIKLFWLSFKKSIFLNGVIRRLVFSFNHYNASNQSNDLYYKYTQQINQLSMQLVLGP